MKEFDRWYYYVESEGRSWPSLGRYDTEAEFIAAKESWKAALKWIYNETIDFDEKVISQHRIYPSEFTKLLKEELEDD